MAALAPGPCLPPADGALFQARYVWSPSFLSEGRKGLEEKNKREKIMRMNLGTKCNIPWLDEMGDGKDDSEKDAEASYYQVGNASKDVFAAYDCLCGEENRFLASVFVGGEVWRRAPLAIALKKRERADWNILSLISM